MCAIKLDGVTVSYGDVTALDNLDLLIPDGELFVLVGPSGCGKTTLLRTIAGLESPRLGNVFVDGQRVTDLPARKRDVGLVFQDFALFPHLSVRENLSFDLRMQGASSVRERTLDVADMLEITHLLDRPIDALSGGQKQRVALGRSLATEPAALLLDEPLANLDAALRDRMRMEIARLQDELDITTVHVTHDQTEALSMGDRVGVMRDGRIVQIGRPEAVYHSPISRFVAEFVGSPSMNCHRGRYSPETGVVLSANDRRSVPVTLADDVAEVVLGVRPEHIVVTPDCPDAEDWIEAHVTFEEFHGADRVVFLSAPNLPEFAARVPGETSVAPGDTLWFRIPPERVHCFDVDTGRRLPTGTGADVRPADVQAGDRG